MLPGKHLIIIDTRFLFADAAEFSQTLLDLCKIMLTGPHNTARTITRCHLDKSHTTELINELYDLKYCHIMKEIPLIV